MKVSRVVAVGLGSAALVVVSSASAFAGEVTGNSTPTQGPAHSNSACAFSGLNDEPDSPTEGGRTQSYGQIVRYVGSLGGANSLIGPFGEDGCNAHMYPNK